MEKFQPGDAAIAAATTSDLIINYPNVRQLNPQRNATRAEISAIAYQALVSTGRASAIAVLTGPMSRCRS